ncbi:aspartic peptidase domain-containing protein [Xylariomycetidae sp. FL2044]|nr:aspartic peptidase domain-containing protein [Xylariomycetidae sp. FL2044]
MHRPSLLLPLTLWVSGIQAISPFYSKADQEPQKRGSGALATPGGFVTFKLVQANVQSIVTANPPTISNAAGIDQDGTDYSYFVETDLGADGKPLYMLLDTGASTTWVMGSSCKSEACTQHNSFGPDDSKTYKDTGKTFSVEYGTGSVSGHIITDTMSIAGIGVDVSFGVANVTSDEFSSFPFDGILGMSLSPDTWLSAVKDANLISSVVFGVSLSRSSDGGNNGEIAFGAPNPAKYTGDVTYTSINSQSTWTIPMDDVTVDGKSAGVTGRSAYIDTGTSFVFGPPSDVEAMYKMIPGASSDGGATYTVPCDSDVPVALTFSGKSWTISSKDFLSAPNGEGVCNGNIYGMEYVKGAWLVGDAFLKNVYSIFDVDQSRIGFAAKASSGGSSTSGPSSTSSAGSSDTPTSVGSSSTASTTAMIGGINGNKMAKAKTHSSSKGGLVGSHATDQHSTAASANEEHAALLAGRASASDDDDDDEDGFVVHPGGDSDGAVTTAGRGSSGPRTPRDPNHRVRFDLRTTNIPPPANGHDLSASSYEFDRDDNDDGATRPSDRFDVSETYSPESTSSRPLLTDMEAPSVALANRLDDADATDDETYTWAERERARPKSGMRAAFMNMANSIIGAGIIGQPYAFRDAGLLAGVVLLVGLTVIVDWTIRLIVINSKLSGAGSFQGTVEHCFGRAGLVAISLAQWAFAFGGMVAFGVIVGDSIPPVLRAIWPGLSAYPVLGVLADRRAVIVIFVMGVSYPLTLYRDISKLAKASTLALISMVIIVTTVVVQGVLTPSEDRGSFSTPLLTVNEGIFQAIGVISFAFVCQHNSLLIYGSLRTPTLDNFAKVTHYSTGVSMLACLVMALAGFLAFGDRTLGNVLNNFPADNAMVTVARLCFGLNMLTTLPLEAFVCREVMLEYYFPGRPFDLRLHLAFSTGLVASAVALSLVTCDLGVVFELVGATSACALAYILPPLCYLRLSSRSWKTYVAWAVVVFGCAVMAISVVQAVVKIVAVELAPPTHHTTPHQRRMEGPISYLGM